MQVFLHNGCKMGVVMVVVVVVSSYCCVSFGFKKLFFYIPIAKRCHNCDNVM